MLLAQDWRLQTAIVLYCHSSISLKYLYLYLYLYIYLYLYLLRHFNAIFMRISVHCNGLLARHTHSSTGCEDYFNCDSCNALHCCCPSGALLPSVIYHLLYTIFTLSDKLLLLSLKQLFAPLNLPERHHINCRNHQSSNC